jgi:hypothetical protein
MLTSALTTLLTLSAPAPEKFLASSERFGYTGTVSVYRSFADATARKNLSERISTSRSAT